MGGSFIPDNSKTAVTNHTIKKKKNVLTEIFRLGHFIHCLPLVVHMSQCQSESTLEKDGNL